MALFFGQTFVNQNDSFIISIQSTKSVKTRRLRLDTYNFCIKFQKNFSSIPNIGPNIKTQIISTHKF